MQRESLALVAALRRAIAQWDAWYQETWARQNSGEDVLAMDTLREHLEMLREMLEDELAAAIADAAAVADMRPSSEHAAYIH